MNPVLFADIVDVKRAYYTAYQFSQLNELQLDRLVKHHYPSTELLLRKVHTLPCQMELIVRLAVHFKCKYHQVLGFMVQEFRNCKPPTVRHTAAYYPDYLTHCKQPSAVAH
jgi:hypothetical protein